MTIRRVFLAACLLLVGFIVGIQLTGRSAPDNAVTASAPAMSVQGRGGTLGLGSGTMDLSAVAELAVKASVNIASTQVTRQRLNPYWQMMTGRSSVMSESQSLGSGVIVSSDGYILTNNHVIGEAAAESITIKVTLPDSRELTGKIVGVDSMTDLAVVKVDAQGLPVLPWADSTKIRLAESVLAVGNPFGLSQTVTSGIVSAISRTGIRLGDYDDFIQTDAAINPGNSGGALVNMRGQLVGINTMIYTETGGYQGIGFAIPANLAQRIMGELIKNGKVIWGSIGGPDELDLRDNSSDIARQNRLATDKGVVVWDIARGSAAFRAGLQQGDIIVSVNGLPTNDDSQLNRIVAEAKIGSTASLSLIRRGGDKVTIQIAVTQAVASAR